MRPVVYILCIILFLSLSGCGAGKLSNYKEKGDIHFERMYMDSVIIKQINNLWEKQQMDIIHYELLPPDSLSRQAVSAVTQIKMWKETTETDTTLWEKVKNEEQAIRVNKDITKDLYRETKRTGWIGKVFTIFIAATAVCLFIRYIRRR